MGKKSRRAAESASAERIVALETDLSAQNHALESLVSQTTMYQRQLEDMQYIDLSGYGTAAQDEILPYAKKLGVIQRIRRLRHENPIAKQSMKLIVRAVFGRGVTYKIKDDSIRAIVDAIWNDPVNQAVLTSHKAMKRRFDEKLTDGEWFPVLFAADAAPWLRIGRVKMEEITDIIYDPDHDEVPVWYRREWRPRVYDPSDNNGKGGWKVETGDPKVMYYRDWRVTDEALADIEDRGLVIPEGKQADGLIYHCLVNEVRMRSGWRGISELYASREWFRVFKDFMEDRGAMNAMANAMSVRRRVKGGPAAVASFANRIGGVQVSPVPGDDNTPVIPRLTRPMAGAVYNYNEGIDIDLERVDTGATNAQADARLLLLAGAAGVGTNITQLGEGSAALSSAQVMDLPVRKSHEDWQSDQAAEFSEILGFGVWVAKSKPADQTPLDFAKEIAWRFPPINADDVVKQITAFAQWSQQIAPGNNEVRRLAIVGGMNALGIPDADQNMDEILAEEKRLADQKEAEQKMRLDQQQKALDAPIAPPGGNTGPPQGGMSGPAGGSSNGNGSGGNSNGQRAGGAGAGGSDTGTSPNITRLARGRPPAEPPTGPRTRREAIDAEIDTWLDLASDVDSLRDEVKTLYARPPMTFNVEAAPPANVTIAEGAIQMTSPPTVISEGAVQVHVPAAQVHVPPAQVAVNTPPPRPIRRKVERDKDGRITALIDGG